MDWGTRLLVFCRRYRAPLLLVLIAFLIAFPYLSGSPFVVRIATMIMVYATLGLALNLPTGYTGQVSLGSAAFFAIGAYTSAILVTKLNWDFFAAFPAAIVLAALGGLMVGLPSLRLSGSYLSIVTLGFAEIVKMVCQNWDRVTNGSLGIKSIPRPVFFGIELAAKNYGAYFLMLAIMLLVSLFVYLLINSKYGRGFMAIREDELVANLMGIRATRYKVLAFVLAAALSGAVGAFYAHFMRYIDPNTFTFDTSILILSIVILGGMGTMRGMYIGALILVSIPEFLRFLDEYRFVFYGLVLLLMMRFRPQGVLGWKSKAPYALPKGVRIGRGKEE